MTDNGQPRHRIAAGKGATEQPAASAPPLVVTQAQRLLRGAQRIGVGLLLVGIVSAILAE